MRKVDVKGFPFLETSATAKPTNQFRYDLVRKTICFHFLDKSRLKLSGWIDNLIEAEWKLFIFLFVPIMGDEIEKSTKSCH